MFSETMTPDQRVAVTLGMNPEMVSSIRERWNESNEAPIIRAILADRIQQQFDELQMKLRRVKPEELPGIQGGLDAFEKAILTVTSRLKNEP